MDVTLTLISRISVAAGAADDPELAGSESEIALDNLRRLQRIQEITDVAKSQDLQFGSVNPNLSQTHHVRVADAVVGTIHIEPREVYLFN